MGIDLLDTPFRIEKKFDIRLTPDDWRNLWQGRSPSDFTAGELFDHVCRRRLEVGKPVDPSDWTLLKNILMSALDVSAKEVQRDAWLVRDLNLE